MIWTLTRPRHILDPRNFRSTLIRGLENIFTAVGGGHVSVSPFIRMGCQFDFITFTVIIGDPPAGATVIFKKFFFPSRCGHHSVLSVVHSTRLYRVDLGLKWVSRNRISDFLEGMKSCAPLETVFRIAYACSCHKIRFPRGYSTKNLKHVLIGQINGQ